MVELVLCSIIYVTFRNITSYKLLYNIFCCVCVFVDYLLLLLNKIYWNLDSAYVVCLIYLCVCVYISYLYLIQI